MMVGNPRLLGDKIQGRLGFVDALRGWAILGVIFYHSSELIPGLGKTSLQFANSGARGVQMFFVLSAFTLFLSLDESSRRQGYPLSRYFINRVFRIVPLYWLALGFYAWHGSFLVGKTIPEALVYVVSAATFTNGFNPRWITEPVPGSWTIIAEIWFYLLLPFLFKWVRNITAAFYFVLSALAVRGVFSAFFESWVKTADPADRAIWMDYIFFWLPNQLPVFGIGLVLFFVFRSMKCDSRGTQAGDRDKDRRGFAGALFLAGAFFWLVLSKGFNMLMPFHFLNGLAFALIAVSQFRWENPLVCNAFTKGLGKISYGAYICHFAVLDGLGKTILPHFKDWNVPGFFLWIVFFSVTLAFTWLSATVLFHLIEVPGRNLGRRISRRWEMAPNRAAAPAPEFSKP